MNTRNFAKHLVILTMLGLLAACGGGGSEPTPRAPTATAAITAQPADRSVVAGTAAVFTVAATGATGYQWQRSTDSGGSFTNINAATNASHTTAASTLPDSGTKYRVVVAGAGNSVTSSAATLTVTAAVVAPSISVQPAAQSTTAGQNASFSVTAAGTALTYQWQRSTDGGASFAPLAGATNATLTLTAVAQADNAQQFRVVVSNSLGSITSSATTLTVNAASIAAAFTLHPSNQSVTAPAVATFTAAAVGTPTPTLQWQENASGSWSDIGGATASSYTTPATLVGDSGKQYRVMATNATANVTSNAARLTVSPAPVAPSFTTQPLSVTITAGQSTQFTAAASGTPTPALQWQLSTDNGTIWSNITGATGTVFNVINAAQGNNGRQFRAVASNGVGPEVNSNSAVLTVNPAATTGWQGNPTPLHADGIAYSPALAGNSAGQAIAMFFVLDNIYANRYGPTTGWEGRVPVSVNDPLYSQTDPQVAINGNGQAFAVWLKSGAGIGQILAARFTPALGWGAPVTLSVNDSGGFAPQIAVDANGNAVAAWVQRASVFSAWQLFSMRFVAANESWEPARRIDSDAIGQPAGINPRVAINPAGEAFVLWAAPGSTLGSIALWATRMAATGVWGGALLVDEGPAVIPEQGLAVDANGNAMAVWKKMDNPRVPSIWSSRFDAVSGSWGSAVAVETSNLDRATSPQVAFDGSGQAVAVWVQYDGTLDHIMSNRHTVAGGWGTPQSIASGAFNRLVEPSLAVNSGGTAVVAWRQAISYVAASIQAPGTAWRTPQLAPSTGSDGLTYSVSFPTVSAALDDNGNATIVWQGDRGASEYRIYSGRFR